MRIINILPCFVTAVLSVGCSGSQPDLIDARELASQAFSEAEAAFQLKDFPTAIQKYATAGIT